MASVCSLRQCLNESLQWQYYLYNSLFSVHQNQLLLLLLLLSAGVSSVWGGDGNRKPGVHFYHLVLSVMRNTSCCYCKRAGMLLAYTALPRHCSWHDYTHHWETASHSELLVQVTLYRITTDEWMERSLLNPTMEGVRRKNNKKKRKRKKEWKEESKVLVVSSKLCFLIALAQPQ